MQKSSLTPANRQAANRKSLCMLRDSLKNDVAGANGVGAVSVWLNRDNQEKDTGIVPDYEICSLSEIANILNLSGG